MKPAFIIIFLILSVSVLAEPPADTGFLRGDTDAASGTSIKVMTYNVREACGAGEQPYCVKRSVAETARDGIIRNETQLVSIINRHNPDILVLQEIPSELYTALLPAVFTVLGRDGRVDSEHFLSGQALFVKGEILNFPREEFLLPSCGFRKFINSVVEVKGQEIQLFQTHLYRPRISGGTAKCPDGIGPTAYQLSDLAVKVAPMAVTTPTIVVGDLNVDANDAQGRIVLNQLNHIGLTDVAPVSMTFPTQPYTDHRPELGSFNKREKIDHIYVSRHFQSGQSTVDTGNAASEASDHFPLISEVIIRAVVPPPEKLLEEVIEVVSVPPTLPGVEIPVIETVSAPAAPSPPPIVIPTETITPPSIPSTPSSPSVPLSTPASSTQRTSHVIAASQCQQCKQLDHAWQIARAKFGLTGPSSTNIWDPTVGKWRRFSEVYPPVTRIPRGRAVPQNLGLGYDDQNVINALANAAQKEGIHPCYPLVVAKYESRGDPNAANAELNLPLCSAAERLTYLMEKSPNCQRLYNDTAELKRACAANDDPNKGGTARPMKNVNACLDDYLNTKQYGVSLPKDKKSHFCSGNFDRNVRYGIGLGAINIWANQARSPSKAGSFTHCELFDPNKNAQAIVSLLKRGGAGMGQSIAEVREAFGSYGGSSKTEGVRLRTDSFFACKTRFEAG